VAAEDLESIDAVRDALTAEVDRAIDEAGGIPVVVRLELTGRSAAHAELARNKVVDDLLADIRAAGLAREPWAWIDRLRDHTRPAIDLDLVRAGSDFAADLVGLTDALLADEQALDEYMSAVASPILGALDSRDSITPDARSVIERARDRALDRLMAEEQR
jgi:hypothetical protein